MAANVPEKTRAKFLDKLLTWREWSYFKARSRRMSEQYDRVPAWARRELAEHTAHDRPELAKLANLTQRETADETWNACQKTYLLNGPDGQ